MADAALSVSTLTGRARATEQAAGPDVARVVAWRAPADALAAWGELEAVAAISPYQTRRWLLPWIETIGRADGLEPLIVAAFDRADRPIALVPLGTRRRGPVRIGTFLGGQDSNFNMGLFAPGPHWTRGAVTDFLGRGTATARVDLLALRNQPGGWAGRDNPFATLPSQPSPSYGYKVDLVPDPELFLRRHLSGESRKKLRQKARRLAEHGPVQHRVGRGADEIGRMLDALIEQRRARDGAAGLAPRRLQGLRDFLDRATVPRDGVAAVEIHALSCGERIVATFAGAAHAGRFCGMLTAFTPDPEIARTSPGEQLLAAVIASKGREGCATFDLGVGEARYKSVYCPVPEALFDSVVPLTALGAAAAASERARVRAKRGIKQTPWAWALVQKLRRLRARTAPRDVADPE